MLHTANKSSGQKEVIDLLHVTDKILREWKEPEWRAARAFSAQLDAIAHLAVDPSSLIPRSAATQPSSRRPSSGDAPQQPYDQPQPSDHLQDGPNFHDPTPQSPSLRPVDHGTGAGAQPQYGQRRGRASGKQRNRRRSGSDRRRNDYLNNGGFVGGSYPGQFNPTAQEPFTVREDHPFDQVGR